MTVGINDYVIVRAVKPLNLNAGDLWLVPKHEMDTRGKRLLEVKAIEVVNEKQKSEKLEDK